MCRTTSRPGVSAAGSRPKALKTPQDLNVGLGLLQVFFPFLLQLVVQNTAERSLIDHRAAHLRFESLIEKLGELFPVHLHCLTF